MKIELSRVTMAIIATIAVTSKFTPVYAMYDSDQASKTVDILSRSRATNMLVDKNSNIKGVIAADFGDISTVKALESILQDSRGTCLGSLRCALALSTNSMIENTERYQDLNLKHEKLGDYAISISGDASKARLVLIAENNGNGNYIEDKVNEYAEAREQQLRFMGIQSEMRIAQSMHYHEICGYSVAVMNPHPEKSAEVIDQGLNLLADAQRFEIAR